MEIGTMGCMMRAQLRHGLFELFNNRPGRSFTYMIQFKREGKYK